MDVQLESYFAIEKWAALLLMVVGVVAIGLSAWLYRAARNWRGMVVPLVAIAVIQIAAGLSVYSRTDAQTARLSVQLQQNPVAFKAEETKRMQAVVENLRLYQVIQATLLMLGLALLLAVREYPFWKAIGAGLAVQSVALLILDGLARNRGAVYQDLLARFTVG